MSAVQSPPIIAPSAAPVTVPVLNERAPAAERGERRPFLDLLRALSAHLIVWHHLAFYGPLSDVVALEFPAVMDFLFEHGRNAVQVFFVLSGFVSAESLGKRKHFELPDAADFVRRRYIRIAGPYICVLLIAILANYAADHWMDHSSISAFPTIPQFLAHAVFLHDLLGYEPLSAGVWYLAIDFQLVLIMVALWWLSHRVADGATTPIVRLQFLLWPLAAASLFWINRVPEWDVWALYFFGSYAFGAVTSLTLSSRLPKWMFFAYAGLMLLAIFIEFRPRLIVSLAVGVLVFAAAFLGWLSTRPSNRWLTLAAASSYSLFLIHFPVCLLVNAWMSRFALDSPMLCLAGLIAAYILSVAASLVFYLAVEKRFQTASLESRLQPVFEGSKSTAKTG